MINDCGFENNETKIGETITKKKTKFSSPTLHTKYVDDLTILEAINLKEALIPNPGRPLPDSYHARLGLKLDESKSKVYDQIMKTENYAHENDMKLNTAKCKIIVFNPTVTYDFVPELQVEGNSIETMEEMKLLGLTLSDDLKWRANTDVMVGKGYKRLWMIRRLKTHGANLDDLKDVFIKQIRSVLEFGTPVWNCGLTKAESLDIERVQKAFLHIALGNDYKCYENALKKSNLESLEQRRTQLCTTFAKKALKHPKHQAWFQPNHGVPDTRSTKPNLKIPLHRLARYRDSPIPYLTNLLNSQ